MGWEEYILREGSREIAGNHPDRGHPGCVRGMCVWDEWLWVVAPTQGPFLVFIQTKVDSMIYCLPKNEGKRLGTTGAMLLPILQPCISEQMEGRI